MAGWPFDEYGDRGDDVGNDEVIIFLFTASKPIKTSEINWRYLVALGQNFGA